MSAKTLTVKTAGPALTVKMSLLPNGRRRVEKPMDAALEYIRELERRIAQGRGLVARAKVLHPDASGALDMIGDALTEPTIEYIQDGLE